MGKWQARMQNGENILLLDWLSLVFESWKKRQNIKLPCQVPLREIKQIMEAMNGRNTAKGQRAAMLTCRPTAVRKEPFALRKGGTAQRKPLPTPRTLQKMLHKYQRPLYTSSTELDPGGSQASENVHSPQRGHPDQAVDRSLYQLAITISSKVAGF